MVVNETDDSNWDVFKLFAVLREALKLEESFLARGRISVVGVN